MHLYLEPDNISSLRWSCVEIELIPPIRVKMVLSTRRMTPVIPTPIMFFTFIWGKKSQPGM